MLICIPSVLSKDEVQAVRELIDASDWVDGRVTAGAQSAQAKKNTQLPEDSKAAIEARAMISRALGNHPLFLSAALPRKVFPPLFNRYSIGDRFGAHVDNAIRPVKNSLERIRTDLSATLFLTEPDTYDGGELVIETRFGAQEVKLEAGDMVLYPASSLHNVTQITRGARISSFFWIESMVRDDGERELLFDLDQSVQTLAAAHGQDNEEVIRLTGIYHNLMRRWANA
ncbi:Fe2+-dependent dioxygenase [Henriciella litoralis]|uniref:Fe2+-dependent dioxygenase n=1 Tax=Henriciella litoralis TaxID=568102 RepID=UPI000A053B5F|nr:Fe2+-dependent dioxygenase [Henriciella litoralis]